LFFFFFICTEAECVTQMSYKDQKKIHACLNKLVSVQKQKL